MDLDSFRTFISASELGEKDGQFRVFSLRAVPRLHLVNFLPFLYKGDNFVTSYLLFLYTTSFLKRGTLKQIICSHWRAFLFCSFSYTPFQRRVKTFFGRIASPPLKCFHFPEPENPGPVVQNLTKLLANMTWNFLSWNMANTLTFYFGWKMWVAFAKATHILAVKISM